MAYYIVETVEQWQQLPKTERCFIDLISLSEQAHPKLTAPCVLYYNDFNKGYIIPIQHSEAFSIPVETVQQLLNGIPKIYLLNKKWHSYFFNLPQAVDLYFNIMEVEGEHKEVECYTAVHLDFHNRHKYLPEVNNIIPISKHYEKSECVFNVVQKYIGKEQNQEWYDEYVEAYKWVEEQGITLNERVFDRFFEPTWKSWSIRDNRIYTSYNMYNTTSRPTNAGNGLNYLAFNKENGSRASFVPENDVFVEFDFDGYHLRLIANMLNLPMPVNESIHTVLGREYFNKQELSPEEYAESKKITFRQLYNGVESEFKFIEFFKNVDNFVTAQWKVYEDQGYLLLPNGRKVKVENPTPQKVLNYYIQCLETVNNVKKLIALKKLLEGKKTKVVLVVYDSVLVDYSVEDEKGLLAEIKRILESDGYRIKAQKGENYDFFNK